MNELNRGSSYDILSKKRNLLLKSEILQNDSYFQSKNDLFPIEDSQEILRNIYGHSVNDFPQKNP